MLTATNTSLPLPSELHIAAFEYLSPNDLRVCSLVSNTFKNLAQDTYITFKGVRDKFSIHRSNISAANFLASKKEITFETILTLHQKWPNLTQLTLEKTNDNRIKLPQGSLSKLIGLFPNLEALSFKNSSTSFDYLTEITDEDLIAFGDNAMNLKKIELRDCPNLSSIPFLHLLKNCTKLSEVRLMSTQVTTKCAISAMSLPSIKVLALEAEEGIDGDCTSAFEKHANKLEHLELSLNTPNEEYFTAEETARIIASQANLKALFLKTCPIITVEMASALKPLSKLQVLHLTGSVTPEIVASIKQNVSITNPVLLQLGTS